MNNFKIAIALNSDNKIGKNHFGDADIFQIFEFDSSVKSYEKILELQNIFKNSDETHGSQNKGKNITTFLAEKKVEVLVSQQFGANISVISQKFLPVICNSENLTETLDIIEKNKEFIFTALENPETKRKIIRIKEEKML